MKEADFENSSPLRILFLESSPRMHQCWCKYSVMDKGNHQTPWMLRRQLYRVPDPHPLDASLVCQESKVDRQNHLQEQRLIRKQCAYILNRSMCSASLIQHRLSDS